MPIICAAAAACWRRVSPQKSAPGSLGNSWAAAPLTKMAINRKENPFPFITDLGRGDEADNALFQRRREDHVLEAGVLAQRIDADKKIELHVMVRLDAELGDDRRRFLGFFVWVFLLAVQVFVGLVQDRLQLDEDVFLRGLQ